MQALGRQILVELYNCDADILKNRDLIDAAMNEAVIRAKATVVTSTFHTFSPFGVSGVVVIAESHVAIHTWPEYGYAAVDIFTCGENIDPWAIHDYLKESFRSQNTSAMEIKRGVFKMEGKLKHKVA